MGQCWHWHNLGILLLLNFYISQTYATLPSHNSLLSSCQLHNRRLHYDTSILVFNELGAYLIPITLSRVPSPSPHFHSPNSSLPFGLSCLLSYTYQTKHNSCLCESGSIHFLTNNIMLFLFMNEPVIYTNHIFFLCRSLHLWCIQNVSVLWLVHRFLCDGLSLSLWNLSQKWHSWVMHWLKLWLFEGLPCSFPCIGPHSHMSTSCM